MDSADLHLVLSDRNRRRILELVLASPTTVSELVRATRLRQPLVSHHLRVLRDAGLILAVREGRFRRYQCASAEVAKKLRELEGALAAVSAAAEKTEGGAPAPTVPVKGNAPRARRK